MVITPEDFASKDKLYRTNLINSLVGPRMVFLVSTVHSNGVSNLAIFNSVFHLGANPSLLGMISRPDTVPRHTLENIRRDGFYSLNSVQSDFLAQAHQTSARYERSDSEYQASGLNEVHIEGIPVPFVEESSVKIFLELKEIIDISLNGTHLIIGEVKQVILPDDFVDQEGRVVGYESDTILSLGLDSYGTFKKIGRLPYAKPS